MQRFFRVSWNCLRWSAFTAVIVACALGLYLYHNLNHEIRAYVERKIAGHYQHLVVSVRSARFVEGKGIEIRGLTLSDRSSHYQSQELVSVDEIMVYCTTDPRRLAGGEFEVQRIVAKRARLTASIDTAGKTNLQHLFPLPHWSEADSDIEIVDASLLLADHQGGNVRRILEDIDLQIKSSRAPGRGAYAGQVRPQKRIKATLKNQDWEAATITGIVDEEAQSFALQGSLNHLRIDSQFWEQIPSSWRPATHALTNLKAIADVAFQASGDTKGLSHYLCTVDLKDGSWNDPRLPSNIERIGARIVVSPPGVQVERLVAMYEKGSITGSMTRQGWQANSPMQIAATLKNVNLHQGLAGLLPQAMQRNWNRYQPSGTIDAAVRLTFDGHAWTPEIQANCRGTNFVFEEFPYPVSQARGKIHFKDRKLEVDLIARAGSARISVSGNVTDPGPEGRGPVRIRSLDPVRWDQTLERALQVAQEEVCDVVRDFHIEGHAHFDFMLLSDGLPETEPEHKLRIEIVDAATRYEGFPYPISKIRGPIVWDGDVVTIEHLEGFNDSGHITCWGEWRKTPDDPRGRLNLQFACKDIPLDDELKTALPEAAQEGWEQLRPRGSVDHIDAHLHWPNPQGELDLTVNAQKWERSRNLSGRAISVEPIGFPYVLDEVVGNVEFRNGHIALQQVTARHGDVRVSTRGSCHFPDDRRWQIHFQDLRVENIAIDRDLLLAVPPKLEQALQHLQISPLLHAEGEIILSNPHPGQPLQINWDMTTHMAGGQLRRGLPISDIYGAIRFHGQADGAGARTFGEYQLDSITCRGVPVSNVRGPFWIDETQFLLGRHVPRNPDQPPRHVTANTMGGSIAVDGRLEWAGDRPFQVDATLSNGTVNQMLIDLGQPNKGQSSGSLFGHISLSGTAQGTHTYDGSGKLQLRDANMYQLPLAVAMLKVLNARFPNTNAFNAADVDFRVAGNYIYLDEMRLSGDALSLKGTGEANLDGKISMRFYTEFGNQSFNVPVIRQVLGEASRNLLVIHVGGSIDQPTTEQEIFPLVNETLEQLFPPRTVKLPLGAPPLPELPGRRAAALPR